MRLYFTVLTWTARGEVENTESSGAGFKMKSDGVSRVQSEGQGPGTSTRSICSRRTGVNG